MTCHNELIINAMSFRCTLKYIDFYGKKTTTEKLLVWTQNKQHNCLGQIFDFDMANACTE